MKTTTTTENLTKYTSSGFRSVRTETMREAAGIFAARQARKTYGRRGYCRSCVEQSYAQDGRLAEFSGFVGYTSGMNETSGHNISFTVYRV